MVDRGRLYYDSNGVLWEIDPNANISGEPDASDLQPVTFKEIITESVDRGSDFSDSTQIDFIEVKDSQSHGGATSVLIDGNVSISAVTIYTLTENRGGAFVIVTGNDGSQRFTDFISLQVAVSPTVQFSEEQNTPPSRTYSLDGNVNLQLAMASGTFEVSVYAMNAALVAQ